jgi:glycine betaine/proline transport system substrate-binding protein
VLVDMLAKFNVPLPLLNRTLSEMAEKKLDAKTQALVFLKAHPAVWRQWVPADVAARVAASLK